VPADRAEAAAATAVGGERRVVVVERPAVELERDAVLEPRDVERER
jgi:hypothetical protein